MYSRVICKLVLNDILMSFFCIVKRLEQRCISAIYINSIIIIIIIIKMPDHWLSLIPTSNYKRPFAILKVRLSNLYFRLFTASERLSLRRKSEEL